MAEHDEVVEQMADALLATEEHHGSVSWKFMAKAALAVLRPGDDLGNGLWAAPEEATAEMYVAAGSHVMLRRKWQAMRRAAGGGDG